MTVRWLACALLTLWLATGCSGTAEQLPQVAVRPVQAGALPRQIQLRGQVRASRRANVSSSVNGTVERVSAEIGDRVLFDQPLIWIGTRDLEAEVRVQETQVSQARAHLAELSADLKLTLARNQDAIVQAQETLRQAKIGVSQARTQVQANQVDMTRKKQLLEEKAIARSQYEQAQLTYKISQDQLQAAQSKQSAAQSSLTAAQRGTESAASQEAQVEGARAAIHQAEATLASTRVQLDQRILRSPIAGVVVARNIEPGQSSGSGPMLTVVDNGSVEVLAQCDILYASSLHRDLLAQVEAHETQARVVDVIPSSDPQTDTVQVRFRLTKRDKDLVDGAVVSLRMILDKKSGILVPRAALRQQQGESPQVQVVQQGILEIRPIEVEPGAEDETYVLAAKGLREGEEVVVSGDMFALAGQKVQVTRP